MVTAAIWADDLAAESIHPAQNPRWSGIDQPATAAVISGEIVSVISPRGLAGLFFEFLRCVGWGSEA